MEAKAFGAMPGTRETLIPFLLSWARATLVIDRQMMELHNKPVAYFSQKASSFSRWRNGAGKKCAKCVLETKAPETDLCESSFQKVSVGSCIKFLWQVNCPLCILQGFLPGSVRRTAKLCTKSRTHRQGRSDVVWVWDMVGCRHKVDKKKPWMTYKLPHILMFFYILHHWNNYLSLSPKNSSVSLNEDSYLSILTMQWIFYANLFSSSASKNNNEAKQFVFQPTSTTVRQNHAAH